MNRRSLFEKRGKEHNLIFIMSVPLGLCTLGLSKNTSKLAAYICSVSSKSLSFLVTICKNIYFPTGLQCQPNLFLLFH